MKNKIIVSIISICGVISIGIYFLFSRIQNSNTGVGIIGGADAPTLKYILSSNPIAFLVICIVFVVLGLILFFKKGKFQFNNKKTSLRRNNLLRLCFIKINKPYPSKPYALPVFHSIRIHLRYFPVQMGYNVSQHLFFP